MSRPISLFSAMLVLFFFFNDTATTEIYTLSLHDALPILCRGAHHQHAHAGGGLADRHLPGPVLFAESRRLDRKSTRLNSSHLVISYAVFCLKKKITRPSVGMTNQKEYADVDVRSTESARA